MTGSPTYDVAVVGLGGMGSATAYHLARRGRRVLGLERFTPGHALGSSHGRSRVIRMAYSENPSYVPLVRRAYALWEETERAAGRPLLTVTGGLLIGSEHAPVVTGAVESARRWDLPYELIDAAEVHRRYPHLTPAAHEVGVVEPAVGFVRPEASVLAHAELARAAGADLRYEEPVLDWTSSGSGVTVRTGAGTYRAARLVLCAGPWSAGLLGGFEVPLTVERQVMHWFRPRAGLEPYRVGRFPVYLWGEGDHDLFYGFPVTDDEPGAKVAFYRREDPADPDTVERTVRPEEVAELAARLEPRLPGLAAEHVESRACLYTMTPDHAFVLGPHPAYPDVVVACGFSGHGFKFVPVIGEILADLATEGGTAHDIALFDPRREFVAGPHLRGGG